MYTINRKPDTRYSAPLSCNSATIGILTTIGNTTVLYHSMNLVKMHRWTSPLIEVGSIESSSVAFRVKIRKDRRTSNLIGLDSTPALLVLMIMLLTLSYDFVNRVKVVRKSMTEKLVIFVSRFSPTFITVHLRPSFLSLTMDRYILCPVGCWKSIHYNFDGHGMRALKFSAEDKAVALSIR